MIAAANGWDALIAVSGFGFLFGLFALRGVGLPRPIARFSRGGFETASRFSGSIPDTGTPTTHSFGAQT